MFPYKLKHFKYLLTVFAFIIFSVPASTEGSTPSSSEILQKVFEKYSGFETYSSYARIMRTIRSAGAENRFASEYKIDIQHPNKFSLLHLDGVFGRTIVSDGKNMWVYVPYFEQYSIIGAPDSFEEVLVPDLDSYSDFTIQQFALFAFASSPENFIDTSSAYPARTEEIDGKVYYIIDMRENNYKVSIVVEKDTFSIKKIELNMTVSANTDSGQVDMHYVEIYDNAVFDSKIDPMVFSFSPPDSARVSDNLLRPEESVFPLTGRYMGGYSFAALDGRRFSLSDFKGRIVILIFVRPEEDESRTFVKEIAREYGKLKDTELILVSRTGTEEELEKLIEDTGNIFTGALDKQPYVLDSIGLRRFPSAVTVGLQGEIQQAYSGYFDSLSSIIAEETALITEGAALISAGMVQPAKFKGMLPQWNLPLNVSDIKTNEKIYAIGPGGNLYSINSRGEIEESINIPSDYSRLELMPLKDKGEMNFILYSHAGSSVHIVDEKAKTVSVFSYPPSVNTVKSADLTADGSFEMILGLAGLKGLKAVSGDGTVIFTSTRIHNVVSVDVIEYGGDSPGILAASAGGPVMIFTPFGELEKVIKTGIVTSFARPLNGSILVSGTSRENEVLKLIDFDGNIKWELILGYSEIAAVTSSSKHPFDAIFSCGTRDGRILVFDMEGNILARGETDGADMKTQWIVFEEAHTYLAASSRKTGITSYIVTGSADR